MFNVGLQITLDATKDEASHLHQQYELIYLLEGSVTVSRQSGTVQMETEDILLINSVESHSVASRGRGRICRLFIDNSVFDDLLGKGTYIFDCDSATLRGGGSNRAGELPRQIREVLRVYLQNNSKIGYKLFDAYLRLLDCLIKDFMVNPADPRALSKSEQMDERIRDVILYVQDNYDKQITLQDLAERFYVSDSHLSRVIKKALGVTYRDYLNMVRIQHAVGDLLYTGNSIVRIANDNGFSNLAVFNKIFKETYGTVPSAYRKQMRAAVKNESARKKKIEEQTIAEIERHAAHPGVSEPAAVNIWAAVDVSSYTACAKPWQDMINLGAANDLLNPKIQEHVMLLKSHLDFIYVRFWGIFNDEMMIFPGKDLSKLNFNRLADAINFLLANKLKPFLQLGPKPRTIISSPGKPFTQVQKSRMVYEFDEAQWGVLIDSLMKHLVQRFGTSEVETWIFEMWRPCHWDGEWFKWYSDEKFAIMHRMIKKYVPGAQAGGCEFVYGEESGGMAETLDYWKQRGAVPDFISFTLFPYGGYINHPSPWITDADFLARRLRDIRGNMALRGLGPFKLYITSWNLTISNRNILNDSVFKGAYIIKNAIDAAGEADMLGYWLCSDAYAEYSDSQSMLFGGAGLISQDGIFKPSMYAFMFLKKLKNGLVAKGDNYIITGNTHGNYTIVYHNLKALNYTVYLKPESELAYHEIGQYFENGEPADITLKLKGVPEGVYNIRTQMVNSECGSILDEWQKFGGYTEIFKEERTYLGQISTPRIRIARQEATEGCLEFHLTAKANEFGIIEAFPCVTQ